MKIVKTIAQLTVIPFLPLVFLWHWAFTGNILPKLPVRPRNPQKRDIKPYPGEDIRVVPAETLALPPNTEKDTSLN